MWHLQKQQHTVVCGGSVFCLTAVKDAQLPSEFFIGEYLQEGFGHIRILGKADMERLNDAENSKHPIDVQPQEGNADDAFIAAVKRRSEYERIPQKALEIYSRIKKDPKLSGLVNGRIRLMTEQASSRDDLKARIGAIKRKGAQKAARALFDGVFNGLKADYANWRELMLAVLHLHYYDKEKRNGGYNE